MISPSSSRSRRTGRPRGRREEEKGTKSVGREENGERGQRGPGLPQEDLSDRFRFKGWPQRATARNCEGASRGGAGSREGLLVNFEHHASPGYSEHGRTQSAGRPRALAIAIQRALILPIPPAARRTMRTCAVRGNPARRQVEVINLGLGMVSCHMPPFHGAIWMYSVSVGWKDPCKMTSCGISGRSLAGVRDGQKQCAEECNIWGDDEQPRRRLYPTLVELGEKAELERFKKMGVYQHMPRDVARREARGNIVKVKWVRVKKGSEQHPES